MTSRAMADTCLGEGSILLSMSSLINFCLKKKKTLPFLDCVPGPREVYVEFPVY